MAAMRCTVCGRNYKMKTKLCPQCGGPVWAGHDLTPDDEPEPDKPDQRDMFGQNLPDLTLPELPMAAIAIYKQQAWVHDDALREWGYGTPTTGDIVRVKGKTGDIFFELGARAMEKATGWWLIRIDPEAEFKDVPITSTDDAR